jgi:hypothetical protein
MMHTCTPTPLPHASCSPIDITQASVSPILPNIALTSPSSVEPTSSSLITSTTSVQPIEPPLSGSHPPPLSVILATLNSHLMHTRSKHGIFKPKLFHTITTDYNHTEPPTYQIASKYPQWCTTMDEAFSALQR